jgi:hypothetical protein
MSSFEVDRFTSLREQEAFQHRRAAIIQTVGVIGLQGIGSEKPGLIGGGAALALQGINSRIFIPGHGPSDVDAIVLDDMFTRMRDDDLFNGGILSRYPDGFHAEIKPSDTIPLPVEIQSNPNPDRLTNFTGGILYTGEINAAVLEDAATGAMVLRAGVLASCRANAKFASVKGLAGLIRAQVAASDTEHPITQDEQWRQAIALSMKRLAGNDLYQRTFFDRLLSRAVPYPDWLKELIQARFDHAAFTDLPRV